MHEALLRDVFFFWHARTPGLQVHFEAWKRGFYPNNPPLSASAQPTEEIIEPSVVTYPLCIGSRSAVDDLLTLHNHRPTDNVEWNTITDCMHDYFDRNFDNNHINMDFTNNDILQQLMRDAMRHAVSIVIEESRGIDPLDDYETSEEYSTASHTTAPDSEYDESSEEPAEDIFCKTTKQITIITITTKKQ